MVSLLISVCLYTSNNETNDEIEALLISEMNVLHAAGFAKIHTSCQN